jgi:demethylspheroidene O-methyltransferase
MMADARRTEAAMDSGIDHSPDLLSRWRAWRARVVGNARFRDSVNRVPLLNRLAGGKAERLFSITSGFVQSQVLLACLETGLLDAARNGPVHLDALPAITRLPPKGLKTLLQAASALGIVHEGTDGYVTLGDFGAVVSGDPGITAMIRHHAKFYRDLADPVALLRGEIHETEMRRLWSYAGTGRAEVGQDAAATYSTLMTASQRMLVNEVIDAYDFSRHEVLLDVGGGEGVFLGAVGERCPNLKLRLFDLPPVAERARQKLERTALSGRASFVGGDFFKDPLPDGSDCIALIRIVFDHDDAAVVRLLSNLRKVMRPANQLVIAEPMAGAGSGRRLATAYFAMYLAAMGSGRCRTPEEIGSLALTAGFARYRSHTCRTPMLATLVVAEA